MSSMVDRLKNAFEKASALPPAVQEQLAAELLEDIEGEMKWDTTLTTSQGALEKLAARALEQQRAGKVRDGGFDEL